MIYVANEKMTNDLLNNQEYLDFRKNWKAQKARSNQQTQTCGTGS